MTLYAKINRDLTDTGKRKRLESVPPLPGEMHALKPYFVPVVEETDDASTGPNVVIGPWVETVEAARLLRARTIRDKTAAEIDAEDVSRVDRAFNATGVDRGLARLLFDHENRLCALEGGPSVTAARFKAALKGLIR